METYAIYLKPKGSLASAIHSDTLFGAFCWSIRHLYGEGRLESLLENFAEDPKFILSSAFPCLFHDDGKVHFYPKPLLPDLTSKQVERLASVSPAEARRDPLVKKRAVARAVENAKRLKAAAYISERLFSEIVNGRMDTEGLFKRLVKRGITEHDIEGIGNALITTGERKRIDPDAECDAFWREADVQRNEIDRVAGSPVEGRLFFTREMVFAQGVAGLWFVLRAPDIDFVKSLLRYLADTGIGGERTAGKGNFTIPLEEIEEVTLPHADTEANAFVTLSRYIPADGEVAFTQAPLSYHLSTIRPKHEAMLPGAGHHTFKTILRVLEPGALIPFQGPAREYYGRIVTVGMSAERGGWQVYHNGMTIPVFAKVGG